MKCSFLVKTLYVEDTYEIAIRSGSFEYNHYSGEYRVVRQYGNGLFKVVSSPSMDYDTLLEKLRKIGGQGSFSSMVYCSEFYDGVFRVGEEFRDEHGIELVKLVSEKLGEHGVEHEVILIVRHVKSDHEIEEYGVRALDDRWVYELYTYVYKLYMGSTLSTGKVLVATSIKELFNEVEHLVKGLIDKVRVQARARRFNPIHTGHWKTLLIGDATCSFYHEIAHLLQADEPVKLPIGYEVGGDLKIVEDPFYNGPLQRVFDDELYPAWRRTLIDDGVVVDYLRTRLTCSGSKPGNARGLFTRPKPLYHQLIVKPGDWGFEEALEELKRVIVVEDIVKAELYDGYITLIPETAYVYDRGSWTLVKNLMVRIPVNQLNRSIIGLTKNVYIRYSYEKNQPIYEVAPSIILEARIST